MKELLNKGYKYRIYPNEDAERFLHQCKAMKVKCWNFLHERAILFYDVYQAEYSEAPEDAKPKPRFFDTNPAMQEFRAATADPEWDWMRDLPLRINEYVKIAYEAAWKSFFQKAKNGDIKARRAAYIAKRTASGKKINPKVLDNIGKPKFKSCRELGFSVKFDCKNYDLQPLPAKKEWLFDFSTPRKAFPAMKIIMHRALPAGSRILSVTFSQEKAGDYYVSFSLTYEAELPDAPTQVDPNRILALDTGVAGYTASDGQFFEAPQPGAKKAGLIARLQRQLERCQKGSKGYEKVRHRMNRAYQKVQRQRREFNHVVSRQLANQFAYDQVVMEDLNIQEMMQRPLPIMQESGHFAKNGAADQSRINRLVADLANADLRLMLNYKLRESGKVFTQIPSLERTNRTCSACGADNTHVHFRMKTWTCSACGATHGKYVNGAAVLLQKAVK